MRKDHVGTPDPKDVTKWLVKPNSRKYYGHSERFAADPEYAEQCRRNGCVDQWGKLAQWIAKPNDEGWEYKDYEAKYEEERRQAAEKKGKGKGKGKGKSKEKDEVGGKGKKDKQMAEPSKQPAQGKKSKKGSGSQDVAASSEAAGSEPVAMAYTMPDLPAPWVAVPDPSTSRFYYWN